MDMFTVEPTLIHSVSEYFYIEIMILLSDLNISGKQLILMQIIRLLTSLAFIFLAFRFECIFM